MQAQDGPPACGYISDVVGARTAGSESTADARRVAPLSSGRPPSSGRLERLAAAHDAALGQIGITLRWKKIE
jgi:hypothetical protein